MDSGKERWCKKWWKGDGMGEESCWKEKRWRNRETKKAVEVKGGELGGMMVEKAVEEEGGREGGKMEEKTDEKKSGTAGGKMVEKTEAAESGTCVA